MPRSETNDESVLNMFIISVDSKSIYTINFVLIIIPFKNKL